MYSRRGNNMNSSGGDAANNEGVGSTGYSAHGYHDSQQTQQEPSNLNQGYYTNDSIYYGNSGNYIGQQQQVGSNYQSVYQPPIPSPFQPNGNTFRQQPPANPQNMYNLPSQHRSNFQQSQGIYQSGQGNGNLQQQGPQPGYSQQSQYQGAQQFNEFAEQILPEQVLDNPLMQVGIAQTQKAMAGTMDKISPGMTGFFGSLKFYFAVDGNYVVKKLKLIMFPYRHTNWKRQGTQGDVGDKFPPPVIDVNCPDLYIPLMAILTHTLLLSLLKGQYMQFTPEVMSDTLSASFLALAFEVMAILGGNWALQDKGGKFSVLEIGIYSSYKYVGVVLNMFVGLFLGFTVFLVISTYTACSSAYFLWKSLSSKLSVPISRRTKLYLVAISILEFLIVFYLGYSSEFGRSTDDINS